jgi:hypothetical protein
LNINTNKTHIGYPIVGDSSFGDSVQRLDVLLTVTKIAISFHAYASSPMRAYKVEVLENLTEEYTKHDHKSYVLSDFYTNLFGNSSPTTWNFDLSDLYPEGSATHLSSLDAPFTNDEIDMELMKKVLFILGFSPYYKKGGQGGQPGWAATRPHGRATLVGSTLGLMCRIPERLRGQGIERGWAVVAALNGLSAFSGMLGRSMRPPLARPPPARLLIMGARSPGLVIFLILSPCSLLQLRTGSIDSIPGLPVEILASYNWKRAVAGAAHVQQRFLALFFYARTHV